MRLMCDFSLEFAPVEAEFGIRFTEKFAPNLARLDEFVPDRLVERDDHAIRVTEAGRLFIRNIAMCFDAYTAAAEGRHSKTI
jgi:oxygen-independent coproporphyrinogen-3 oxidase